MQFGDKLAAAIEKFHEGNYADSEKFSREILEVDRNNARALNLLGMSLHEQGSSDDALSALQRAIEISPEYFQAHNNRATVYYEKGLYEFALRSVDQAISIKHDAADAYLNKAQILCALGYYENGAACAEKSIALDPTGAQAHSLLGAILSRQGRAAEALTNYSRAIDLGLGDAETSDAWLGRGQCLFELGRYAEALAAYERPLAVNPKDVKARVCLANALFDLGRIEEAMAHFDQALAINPKDSDAYNGRGVSLRALGRLNEAIQAFETAIALEPRKPGSYLNFVTSKRITASHPYFAAMQELARDINALKVEDQIWLHFALGKVFADLGDQQRSFYHLLEGNSLKRRQVAYDEAKTLDRFERIRTVFTAELIRDKRGPGDPSSVPIFIVGMPRSGTTLVEQILSSHSKVFGAEELRDFADLSAKITGPDGIPEAIRDMSIEQLRELGMRYVQAVRRLAPEAERITDKLPFNFASAGLIHLALPKARVIHVMRDPRDTALSCFSLQFMNHQMDFAYSLDELGRYIRAYEALMEHWRNVLPKGAMLEVRYEALITNLEEEARRMIAYCGLEWDDACLAFHQSERQVRTASVTQVRQPLYASSVGRWRLFEEQLQPLLRALAGS